VALPTSCTAERLPMPAGTAGSSVTFGADPTGPFILGMIYVNGGFERPVLWDDGRLIEIPVSGEDAAFHDINSAGVAVGSGSMGADRVGWVYRNGTTTQLKGSQTGGDGHQRARRDRRCR
jgi:hypothetical protein